MMFPRPIRSLLLCAVLLAGAAVSGLLTFAAQHGTQNAPPHRPASAAPANANASGYIDPAMCAQCHQKIAQSFRTTGMGRSFANAGGPALASLFNGASVDNQPSGMHYVMLQRDGKLYQRRFTIGYRGQQTNILDEQVDYVIGSGNHAHTFLHRNPDGRLIELPVTWYSDQGGSWAMSPGYDRANQEDFRRAVPGECMFCHNAYPRPLDNFNRAQLDPPAFPRELPQGVDCQRCHGPGAAHVKAVLAGAGSAAIRAAIVNPARLSRDRQLEVCMQCHLETSSSHMPNEIRRYDRALYSYRPGQPLGDYKIYFDPVANQKTDRFEIAHAAYRLRMSACFRNSQMTCLTCHDPHASYRGAGMEQHYIAVCESCHQGVKHTRALPAGATCLSCHMPQRRTDDAVHVVMTDHYIQRVKPDRDLLAPKPEQAFKEDRGGIVLYYPPQLPPAPQNELYLDVAHVKDGSEGAAAIARLRDAIETQKPAAPEFYFELAHAYFKAGQNTEAIPWYQQALQHRRVYPAASKELAVALLAEKKSAQAEAVLQTAALATPSDPQLEVDLGNFDLRHDRPEDAHQRLSRALALNPQMAQAENLLGLLALRKKDNAAAEKWLRGALRDNPVLAEAHTNLANALSGTGDYQQAAYQFQQAIRLNANDAEAHHGYGLMLELMHSYDQAAGELEQAARLDAGDAQIHGDLADLLAARGQLPEAETQYKIALAGDPGSADLHVSLGGVLSAEGNRVEAAEEFRKALAIDPRRYDADLGLAVLLAQEGHTADAKLYGRKAAESPDPALRGAALNLLRQIGN
jgi:predicted CXXCH cytochrome family protein